VFEAKAQQLLSIPANALLAHAAVFEPKTQLLLFIVANALLAHAAVFEPNMQLSLSTMLVGGALLVFEVDNTRLLRTFQISSQQPITYTSLFERLLALLYPRPALLTPPHAALLSLP
jgi:hypothetical protein